MYNYTPIDLAPSPKKISPKLSLLMGIGLIVASAFMVGSSYFLAQNTDPRSRAQSPTLVGSVNTGTNGEPGPLVPNTGNTLVTKSPNSTIPTCPEGTVPYDKLTQLCPNPVIVGAIGDGGGNTNSDSITCCKNPSRIPPDLICRATCPQGSEGLSCGGGRICKNIACDSGSANCDAIDIRCINPECPNSANCTCDAPPTLTPTNPPEPLKCGEICVEGQNTCGSGLRCANTTCAPNSTCEGGVYKCVKETCIDPTKCRCDCTEPSFGVSGKNNCLDCDG